jgi:hypothetical protein
VDNKEKKRLYDIEYREKNKDRIRARRHAGREQEKEYMAEWRLKNAEHIKQYSKKYASEKPTKIKKKWSEYYGKNAEQLKDKARKYFQDNKEVIVDKRRGYLKEYNTRTQASWKQNLRKYGITPDEYMQLLSHQNDTCAICGRGSNGKRKLFVDHCHNTGTVRGLLCTKCNTVIGMANDSLEIIRRAVKYLEKYEAIR